MSTNSLASKSSRRKLVAAKVPRKSILRGATRDLAALSTPDIDPIFYTPTLVGKPSAWWGHVPFAFWLMSACRPRLFVELGTHYGVSYAAFCEANLIEGIGAQCIAVDTWQGDDHAGFYGQQVFDELNEFNSQRYGTFSRLVRSTFKEALSSVADSSVDLLHIDGRHAYEDAREDFESWLPKLSDRAVVIFHDTNVRERGFGVYKLFAEQIQRFPSFEFLHGYGLGLIIVGRNPPAAVALLCGLRDQRQINTLKERFNQLGSLWSVPFTQTPPSDRYAKLLADRLQAERLQAGQLVSTQLDEKMASLEEKIAALEASYVAAMHAASAPLKFSVTSRLGHWALKLGRLGRVQDLSIIRRSPFFDAKWYLETNPDIAKTKIDPAKHYLDSGFAEGRDPGPHFSGNAYLLAHKDVKDANVNPLVHFERVGRVEKRLGWLRGEAPVEKPLLPMRKTAGKVRR